jgi:hypothetical protein
VLIILAVIMVNVFQVMVDFIANVTLDFLEIVANVSYRIFYCCIQSDIVFY